MSKLLWIFRAIFAVVVVAVLLTHLSSKEISGEVGRANFYAILWSGVGLAVAAFIIDVFTPKKSLAALAGMFFGLLVGIFVSWALAPVLEMINEIYRLGVSETAIQAVKWMMGVCICYLTISVVMRTKDDVRFVIPYVEFSKQMKGTRPLVLDTSAIIDGRIADLYQSKLFDAPLIVPRFVLNELQLIADSADKLKRNRGRRGLDILNMMQTDTSIDIEIDDSVNPDVEEVKGVDQKLMVFTKHCNGRLATTDYNLSKVAKVREVDVMNINDLASSLKTIALPGEVMEVRIQKPGEEAEQGIGYLDDGTMVVVEGARNKIGRDVVISITSSLQTSAGKMIFGRFEGFAQKGNDRERTAYKKPAVAGASENDKN
ncbi:MAG: TRAM domain-containing protein [Phycisphaerae bacterium]|nr:TRAM domain-containing protein [Phycisphaerae bacterium]MDD5381602.1 TRAM domain-containing protein [Phycisphaerae bacterium]